MITINKECTSAEISEGVVVYTDGYTFTQVETATGHILSITQGINDHGAWKAVMAIAIQGPPPPGAWFKQSPGITLGGDDDGGL